MAMNTYTAFNIGPIYTTFIMGRRPRELWAASYMFSYLMKCICDNVPKGTVLSPAEVPWTVLRQGVGLYPDRLFVRGAVDVGDIEKKAWQTFSTSLNIDGKILLDRQYFNIMHATVQAGSDSVAVRMLNDALNKLELMNFPKPESLSEGVMKIVLDQRPLFLLVYGEDTHHIPSLGEIAAVSKKKENVGIWNRFSNLLNNDGAEENAYKETFGEDYKSYHKYICVVKADGDSVGATVTHPDLPQGKLEQISDALLCFGRLASEKIKGFGGLPIYAGGDDLLFIAPVVGEDGTDIFRLLKEISTECFKGVKNEIDGIGLKKDGNTIRASMSYGLSISYYKFPLYEALELADSLLNKAKGISGKNAVAWKLTKHSGSGFEAAFSSSDENLSKAFYALIDETKDGNTVSAVAHKLRENAALMTQVLKTKDAALRDERLKMLFEKILEDKGSSYHAAVREMMERLYDCFPKEGYEAMLYSAMRTAKFIKGEDPKDE